MQDTNDWTAEYPLTMSAASILGDILRGVEQGRKLRYYPEGADSADYPVNSVMRAITHDGGGFWFDSDGDVRNAFIWTSGMFEHWYPVVEVMRAIHNQDGHLGMTKPMAIIED